MIGIVQFERIVRGRQKSTTVSVLKTLDITDVTNSRSGEISKARNTLATMIKYSPDLHEMHFRLYRFCVLFSPTPSLS